jgi:hypothetical protein
LGKDVFLGRRESDALMVAYTRQALWEDRVPGEVIPEVMRFFEVVEHPNLPPPAVTRAVGKPCTEIPNVHVAGQVLDDEFGYGHIRFRIPGARSTLTALHTPSVQNIEKIQYRAESPDHLAALLDALLEFARGVGVQYLELFVPTAGPGVSGAAAQRLCLGLGLKVIGYVPSWLPWGDSLVDCVVFGALMADSVFDNLQLLPAGERLRDEIALGGGI